MKKNTTTKKMETVAFALKYMFKNINLLHQISWCKYFALWILFSMALMCPLQSFVSFHCMSLLLQIVKSRGSLIVLSVFINCTPIYNFS